MSAEIQETMSGGRFTTARVRAPVRSGQANADLCGSGDPMRRRIIYIVALILAAVALVLLVLQLACPKPPGHPLPADETPPPVALGNEGTTSTAPSPTSSSSEGSSG